MRRRVKKDEDGEKVRQSVKEEGEKLKVKEDGKKGVEAESKEI